MDINTLLDSLPKNETIVNNAIKAYHKINSPLYKKILCSISGGADSDVLLDICTKCDTDHKVDYVWYDTGLEYQATKDHLKYLEKKYGIEIIRQKAIKSIPTTCKQYGQPFLSKRVSDYVARLQRHGFDFVDRPFEELCNRFPKCKSALMWWCNLNKSNSTNICRNQWLKEFMIDSPPHLRFLTNVVIMQKKAWLKITLKNIYVI